mgnify:CR=1 FL=1
MQIDSPNWNLASPAFYQTSNKVTPKKSEKRFCTAPEHTFQASLVFAFVKAQYNDVFDVKMRYLTCVSAINGISGTDSFDGDTQTFTSWSSVMSSSTNVAPESEIVPQHWSLENKGKTVINVCYTWLIPCELEPTYPEHQGWA